MCDKAETVKRFFCLGNRLNASGGCEATATARTKVGWKKFREHGERLFGKRFSLQMKGKVYKSYVRDQLYYMKVKHGVGENSYFEKSRKIYGEGNVQCKVGGQEEYNGADEHVGIKKNSR